MIDFEGYYLVPPDQVAYIETRRGGGDAQYGLFLGLTGGKELGVWYRTEEARKAAYTKLARQVEIGKRQDREDILYRLRLIEACINKTDKRTLRISAPTTAASGKRGDGMSGRTTERILNAAAKGLLFLLLYVMLDLCWIGAECVFEGIVHESRVDGVVLAWLCLLLVREIEQFERKIRGDRR